LKDPFLPFARSGMRPGLLRIRRLLAHLGHPERSFKSVLVTGSNGKGTTCAVLAACLQGFGFDTGLFTSPHLVSVRERFRINGVCATQAAMNEFLRRHGALCRRVGATYFETTTAFALWWFRERGVHWVVLEIGLGGRHDACNAVDPELSIVTSIALEHTQWLGSTQARIAAEKAWVARPGRPTLTGPLGRSAERSLRRTVAARGGHVLCFGHEIRVSRVKSSAGGSVLRLRVHDQQLDLSVRIVGAKAVINTALAAAAAMHIRHSGAAATWPRGWQEALRRSVRQARWPARLDRVRTQPFVIADVAHNEAAVAALVADWRRLWPRRRPVLLVGLLDDKPVRRIGALLSRLSSVAVVTRPDSERAVEPEQVAAAWRHNFERLVVATAPRRALERALELAGPTGSLLVTGSHYVVGPVLAALGADPTEPLSGRQV
jgi:dihydrofolate synthase/folylpolyglutamate synthase